MKKSFHCYSPDVILGCTWSDWTEWSTCSRTCGAGGVASRVRERLPGLGTCEEGGDREESACEGVEACPLETDVDSLVLAIGGETSASRENEHSTSVEVLGRKGPCREAGE